MGLTMREKQAVTKQLALSYRRASKGKRGEILDWLVELTGYNRSYAARILRQRAKPKVLGRLRDGDVEVILVEPAWRQTGMSGRRGGREGGEEQAGEVRQGGP